jgi:hypothetical protein
MEVEVPVLLVNGEFVHAVVHFLVITYLVASPQLVIFGLAVLLEADAALFAALEQLLVLFVSNINTEIESFVPFVAGVQLNTIRLCTPVA